MNNIADKEFIANQLLILRKAFPSQPATFFEVLRDRIIANKFTEKELEKAIHEVIDTFEYKSLTVAAIIKKRDEPETPIIDRLHPALQS